MIKLVEILEDYTTTDYIIINIIAIILIKILATIYIILHIHTVIHMLIKRYRK